MAAEWKESFDKSRFSNQWEHIYAAGWKAAKAAEALKPSHNNASGEICPHFDTWQFLDNKGNLMYKVPACTCGGQTSHVA